MAGIRAVDGAEFASQGLGAGGHAQRCGDVLGVEGPVAEGRSVLVRDTQNRALGHIDYSVGAWATFLNELKQEAP